MSAICGSKTSRLIYLSTKSPFHNNFTPHRAMGHCSAEAREAEAKRVKNIKHNECRDMLYTPPTCPATPPKPGFWRRFFSCEDDKAVKPTPAMCRKRMASMRVNPPDLSFIGGQMFRTCGEAYVVQKDLLPVKPTETSRETRILQKIELPTHCLLGASDDPLDKITRAELRLIALHEHKLHPNYKQLDSIPKQCPSNHMVRTYNTISGPLDPNDIPVQLKFNTNLLDKKNIMYDFKRVEPPMALVAPIIEMRKNHRPTLEKKKRYDFEDKIPQSVDQKMTTLSTKKYDISRGTTKSAAFDTLQQNSVVLANMLSVSEEAAKQEKKENTAENSDKKTLE